MLDLWDRAHEVKWLHNNVTPLRGPRRTMSICLVNYCDLSNFTTPDVLDLTPWIWDGGHDGPWVDSSCLEIEVQDFEPLPGKEYKHILDVTLSDSNKTVSTSPRYNAIPTECFPSLETLETWVLDTTRHSRQAFFASTFHGTFLSLALRYCECERDLPLVSFSVLLIFKA
jgi:hypothetical protein